MIDLFGRKKKRQDEKLKVLQQAACSALMTQMTLAGAFDEHDRQARLVTNYGHGYIFGFSDALIQRAGDINDVQGIAALTIIHVMLFGEDKGGAIMGASLRRQADPEFSAGRMLGGTDAMQWLSGKISTPMGLGRYLIGSP